MIVSEVESPTAGERCEQLVSGRLTEVALGYQRILEGNPHHPRALLGMSLVALASRQTNEAVLMAQAAAAVAPELGAAWVTLGHALKTARCTEEAQQAFGEAIRLDGMDAAARTGMAELRLATERPEEVPDLQGAGGEDHGRRQEERETGRVLAGKPAHHAAHHGDTRA